MKSDIVKKGVERAPHRSLFKAIGYTDEELKRPLIGIANSENQIIPGHTHIDKIVEAVKAGIYMAGGTPIEFGTIGVCDGIAMNHTGMKYSLGSRELIADSIEVMAISHAFDAMVMVPNCDKIVPGMLMAAARLDIPSIVISGGPMLAGRLPGRKDAKKIDLITLFECVGAVRAGKMTEEELAVYEDKSLSAQKKVEGRNFDIRKHLVSYDDVINKHREIIYARRKKVLTNENLKKSMEHSKN